MKIHIWIELSRFFRRREVKETISLFLLTLILLLLASFFYQFTTGKGIIESMEHALRNMFAPEEGPLIFLIFTFFALFAFSSAIIYLKDILITSFSLVRMRRIRWKGHVIICGAGRLGSSVAFHLKQRGIRFVLIENDEKIADQMEEKGYKVLRGDCLDEAVLKRANIKEAKALVACLGKDDDNLFLIITAKSMNPSIKVLARASDERNLRKMQMAGADFVITPEWAGGKELASNV